MNKSLYAIIVGIVVVGGLIGYTMTNNPGGGTALPHNDTGLAPHQD